MKETVDLRGGASDPALHEYSISRAGVISQTATLYRNFLVAQRTVIDNRERNSFFFHNSAASLRKADMFIRPPSPLLLIYVLFACYFAIITIIGLLLLLFALHHLLYRVSHNILA